MTRSHQQETRRESRQSISDDDPNQSMSYDNPNSKVATKRLFSNRTSVPLSLNNTSKDENDGLDLQDEETPPGKRHRSSDWPLSSATPATVRARSQRDGSESPPRSSSQARASRFMEGSMRDRASQKPPIPYLGEDTHNQGMHGDSRGRKGASGQFTYHPNTSIAASSTADRSDTSRQSGIFRFGKSLATAFNPGNWKIWSKSQRHEYEETPQENVLRERREKAEKLYQELKMNGGFEQYTDRRRSFSQQPKSKATESKHDSGISFDSQPVRDRRVSMDSSQEEKRKGRIFLEPPQVSQMVESPRSSFSAAGENANMSPSKKQIFHFKKPSLSNMKKEDRDQELNLTNPGDHRAQRMPSRKDLQKQQRLVKRVSDLEAKLDAARRQLTDSLHEPLPAQTFKTGRSRFVPGALATLPSESLLAGYLDPNAKFEDYEGLSGIGKAVTRDQAFMNDLQGAHQEFEASHVQTEEQNRVSRELSMSGQFDKPPPASPRGRDLQSPMPDAPVSSIIKALEGREETPNVEVMDTSPPTRKPSKKRKSSLPADDSVYKPPPDPDSDIDSGVKGTVPRKASSSRPRKLQMKTQDQAADNASLQDFEDTPLTPEAKVASQDHRKPGAARRAPVKKLTALVHTPPPASKKSKIPRKNRQSASPPQEASSFTGLEYNKPSTAKSSNKVLLSTYLVSGQGNNTTTTAENDNVPPLPKMPKAVRLPSGEIISTAPAATSASAATASTSTSNKHAKLRASPKSLKKRENDDGGDEKSNKHKKTETSTANEKGDDEWPDYVF